MTLPFITYGGKDMCFTIDERVLEAANELLKAPDYMARKQELDSWIYERRNTVQAVMVQNKAAMTADFWQF